MLEWVIADGVGRREALTFSCRHATPRVLAFANATAAHALSGTPQIPGFGPRSSLATDSRGALDTVDGPAGFGPVMDGEPDWPAVLGVCGVSATAMKWRPAKIEPSA